MQRNPKRGKSKAIVAVVVIAGCCAPWAAVRAEPGGFREFTRIEMQMSGSVDSRQMVRRQIRAQRSDGSHMEGELKEHSEVPVRRFVSLWSSQFPTLVQVRLDDELKSKTTLPFPESRTIPPPVFDPQCGVSHIASQAHPRVVGEETLLGFRTIVIQTQMRMSGISGSGQEEWLVGKEWRAPDLNCAELRFLEERRDADAVGQSETRAVKVLVGPPDVRLFAVPDYYAEKSPSQMRAMYPSSGGLRREVAERMEKRLAEEDRKYFAQRQAVGLGQ